MNIDYDIAVVGGGLAGASLACALADTGLSIALIEAVSFDQQADPRMQARTTALAWGTRALFDRLGLWAEMAEAATPIERLHVSQQGKFGTVRVDAAEYDLPALGYVLPNPVMVQVLRQRLQALPGVDVIAPARFETLHQLEESIDLVVNRDHGGEANPERFKARLVIGADGARSSVREALGIGARTDDYRQSAVVTSVATERPHNRCAYERFTPEGPVALLPNTADACAAVWTLPTARAKAICQADDRTFITELQSAFGRRLGSLSIAGPRGAFPLARVLCDRAATRRAVLIGNAGHALHPAAAQGFNLAIRDALVFAFMLRERMSQYGDDFDPGSADLLEAWAEARAPDQHRVANFTDAIVRVFSNRVPGLGSARGAGLLGLSLLPDIRHDMARRSMGLALASGAAGGKGNQR